MIIKRISSFVKSLVFGAPPKCYGEYSRSEGAFWRVLMTKNISKEQAKSPNDYFVELPPEAYKEYNRGNDLALDQYNHIADSRVSQYDGLWNDREDSENHWVVNNGTAMYGGPNRPYRRKSFFDAKIAIDCGAWFLCDENGKEIDAVGGTPRPKLV